MKSDELSRFENLCKGLQDSTGESLEDIKKDLRAMGIDPNVILAEASEIVASHIKTRRLAWVTKAKEKRDIFLRTAENMLSWKNRPASEIQAGFDDFLAGKCGPNLAKAAFAWRNRTNITEAEKIALLDSLKLLSDMKPKSNGSKG